MRRSLILALLVGLFGLFFCLPASGEGTKDMLRLDPVEVVSSPVIEGNQVDSYGSLTTEVNESQIEGLNAQDLGTALRMSPGVTISRYNKIGSFGGGEGGAVFIRGLGSGRPGSEIKTYIHGVPMYMGVWNHPLLDLLSIDPAKSIRVAKSPQPQNFGNALAAINIEPKARTNPGFTTKLELAGGSYSTLIETAEHGGKVGRFDYYLGQGYRTSNGHRDHSEGTMRSAFANLGYELNDNWRTGFFGLHTDNEAQDPGEEGMEAASAEERYETSSFMGIVSLSHVYPRAKGELKAYANTGEGDWFNQEGPDDDTLNDFLFYGLKARENLSLWPGGELILGTDWEYTQGEAVFTKDNGARSKWGEEHFSLFSPYAAVSHRIELTPDLSLTPSAGLRAYEHSEFDSEAAPHAGLLVGYKDTQLHMGYSRGVIYPGLEVVVMSQEVLPFLGDSWQELDAETTDHFEIGLSHSFSGLARADCTFFYDEGENRYVVVPPPPPPPAYENVESYRIRGAEFTLSLYPLDSLSLFASLTLLDTNPGDLPYAPQSTVSTGLNWRFLSRFKLSLDSQYVNSMHVGSQARKADPPNKQEVGDHFLVNGKLSYLFKLYSGKIQGELFLSGENLTDTDYEYRPGYPMAGINGMLGMEFSL